VFYCILHGHILTKGGCALPVPSNETQTLGFSYENDHTGIEKSNSGLIAI
jgi:hypothetical protein